MWPQTGVRVRGTPLESRTCNVTWTCHWWRWHKPETPGIWLRLVISGLDPQQWWVTQTSRDWIWLWLQTRGLNLDSIFKPWATVSGRLFDSSYKKHLNLFFVTIFRRPAHWFKSWRLTQTRLKILLWFSLWIEALDTCWKKKLSLRFYNPTKPS